MLETVPVSTPSQTEQFKMPIVRRKRAHLTSTSRIDQIEAQGHSYLCFAEDQSWFQGNINTEDESNYSLYGERVSYSQDSLIVEQNNNEVKPGEQPSGYYYKATLIDHFTGLTSTLPKISVNPHMTSTDGTFNGSLFCCPDGLVSFKVENVFKGQKADMIIQRYLGSATLLGRKCLVYSGAMNIVFNEVIDSGRSWCL